jgi:hypothetical protein
MSRQNVTTSRPIADEPPPSWRCVPRNCRGLAFLRAHADVLRNRIAASAHA